jgi:tetrahydromethanopterin S-methyltransferase subunit C
MGLWIWRSITFVLCAYAALAVMPALYASELNRDFVAFGVSHGAPAVAVLIAACIAEFLLLYWLARLVAEIVAMVITRVVEWVFDMLDFVCGPVLRLVAWIRED